MMNSAPMKSITIRLSGMTRQHCATRRWIAMASQTNCHNLDRKRCSLRNLSDSSKIQISSQVLRHYVSSPPSCNVISNAPSLCQFSSRRTFSTTNTEEEKFELEIGSEGIPKSDPSTIDRSKFTDRIQIRMPDMGEGKNKIVQWYKQEGDIIATGDILCDIETPDFTFGMSSDDECDAIMDKILVSVGDPVRDEEVICEILHPSEDQEEEKKET